MYYKSQFRQSDHNNINSTNKKTEKSNKKMPDKKRKEKTKKENNNFNGNYLKRRNIVIKHIMLIEVILRIIINLWVFLIMIKILKKEKV